jgi:heat shock protein HslJ
MMIDCRPIAGCCVAVLALVISSIFGSARTAEPFPFDQELVLDVRPMAPVKRVPILTVTTTGEATIDLWCKTVHGRVEFADRAIRIEPGPLPDALPQYMTVGQCTPERMQADQDTLALLAQVTSWRKQGTAVVLGGPIALRFLVSSH